jgi:hypothetical protein
MAFANFSKSIVIGLSLLGTGAAQTARADWHSFWHTVRIDYARNNTWPQPFSDVDAKAVQAPFAIMKHNGWRAHNTIGNELFRQGDAALTLAGTRRVHWIATQAPQDRRVIYVLRGADPQETEMRLASVNRSLAAIHTGGQAPEVVVTDIEPVVASGGWATSINRQWMENLPAPKLPSTTAAGSSGATSDN